MRPPRRRTVRVMRDATIVTARLDRIAALDEAGAPAATLLDELHALACEAARWAAAAGAGEGTAVARVADHLAATLDREPPTM